MTTTPAAGDPDRPCKKCGLPHPGCAGHTRAGRPCGSRPMDGQRVCRMHGGSAPQNLAAGERNQVRARAAKIVERFGPLPVGIDPAAKLLELVATSARMVAFYEHQLEGVTDQNLIMGVAEQTMEEGNGPDGPSSRKETVLKADPHVLLRLYNEERDRLADLCAKALRAGIEERQVRLAEGQGQMVAAALRRILDALQLTPEQQARVPVIVPAELRAIAAGGAA